MTMTIETRTLAGGATLIHKPVTHNNILAIRATLPYGAASDTAERAGLANLSLRLLLKGTRTRDAEAIALAVESQGAQIGVDVQKDYSTVALLCTSDTRDDGAAILGEVLTQPSFPPEKFENERAAVLKQIREEDDRTLMQTFRLFQSRHFEGHPYATPGLGLRETVTALTRDDAADFWSRIARLDRGVLVIVGPGQTDDHARLLDRVLAGGASGNGAEPRPDVTSLPAKTADAVFRNVRETEAEWIVLGYTAPSVTSPDYFPFKVLDSVMGGSMDSRLFNEVREKRGLAYEVGTDYPIREGNAHFAVYLGTAPANHDLAIETVLGEIRRIREEVPGADEVERAKTYLRGLLIMSQESNRGQASLLTRSAIYGLGLNYADQCLERIAAVTPEQVRDVAERYLTHYTLAVTAPEQ